jgi:cyclic beta-1,2-glucan synthetase
MQIAPQVIPSESTKPDADNRLREFAHQLVETHLVGTSHLRKTDLLEELQSWELALRNANTIFKTVPAKDAPVSRAGEWMLDNFYIVKQTLRQIEEDLPASFLSQLPTLKQMPLRGNPDSRTGGGTGQRHTRIFALAREWIEYSQSQIDLTQAAAFVQEYQQVTPLTIGELWALPIMLRIGVLEQLVYATSELTGMEVSRNPSEIPNQFASPPLPNETIVANCFLSLRLLAATDWETFFEQTSRVEQILRDDPAQIYANMDFETRNSYRSVVEELAHHSAFNDPFPRPPLRSSGEPGLHRRANRACRS